MPLRAGEWRSWLIATAVAALACLLPVPWQIGVATLAVVAFGLPHGAADAWRMAQAFPRPAVQALMWGTYLLLTIATAAAFMTWPVAGLLLFLLASAGHFGLLDRGEAPRWSAPAFGLLPILASTAFWPAETIAVLRLLGWPASTAEMFIDAARLLLIVASIVVLAVIVGASRRTAMRGIAATAALILPLLLLPPWLGFALYFGVLHAPRHLRSMGWSTGAPWRDAGTRWAWLATLLLAALAWVAWPPGSAAEGVARMLVAGLAGLTLPHLFLDAWLAARPPPPAGSAAAPPGARD
ncbi:MAG: beta-carotene 15,15'-dioxygenase, Brp/Blh family [Silanimonas sp.]